MQYDVFNGDALDRVLEAGARVRYFNHHHPGDIPVHPEPHIDTDANVCTSLLVNRYLQGKRLTRVVTGAFGGTLADTARREAAPLNLSAEQRAQLQSLCECLNYNGYGKRSTTCFPILPTFIGISSGADEICSQFETGGGRRGAAGINHLPDNELDRFMTIFYTAFTQST